MMHPRWALLSVLALFACGGEAPPAEVSTTTAADTALLSAESLRIAGLTLAAAAEVPWRDTWRLPGRMTSDPDATQPLGSVVEGRVASVRVFPGDRVREGDVLATIHTHEVMDARQALVAAQAAALVADSAAVAAQRNAARAERLLANRAIAVAEAERARAAAAGAAAQRDAAQAELVRADGYLEHLVGHDPPSDVNPHEALLRAPFDGVVTTRHVQPGEVVLVGAPLLAVARDAGLGVQLQVPESGAAALAVGSELRFEVAAYPGQPFTAVVRRVSPVVDPATRSVDVWARAVGRLPAGIRAEMTADVELVSATAGGSVLVVPLPAVQLFEGDTVAILATRLGEGMLVEARRLRVGRRGGGMAEVLEGLSPGDSVVLDGAALAKAEILRRKAMAEGGDAP